MLVRNGIAPLAVALSLACGCGDSADEVDASVDSSSVSDAGPAVLCGEDGVNVSARSPEYPALFDGCTHFQGSLDLSFANPTDLSDMEGLRKFDGSLSLLFNNELVSLHGLEQLREIGTLRIDGAPLLGDVRALRELSTVRGLLSISAAYNLESLQGLENLEQCGSLALTQTSVSSLEELRALREIAHDLTLFGDFSDAELRAFVARVDVRGSIQLNGEVWTGE